MTNLEHLVENGLIALENGRNYNEWLEQMKEDINWNCYERLTIDDLWEICQYVFYVWTADRKTKNSSEKPNNCEDEPQTSGIVWTEDAIKDEPKSYSTWASTDEPQTERSRR